MKSRRQTHKTRSIEAGPSSDWGSGRHGQVGLGIDFGLEQVTEAGAELAVENGAADLEQEIGAAAGPSHLLGFVHAAVDRKLAVPSVSAVPTRRPARWRSA
jgi:hypothetical protein